MKKKIIIATGLVLYELIFNNKSRNVKERNESIEAHISPIKLIILEIPFFLHMY